MTSPSHKRLGTPKRLAPTRQAADEKGVPYSTIRSWIRKGLITGYRVGPAAVYVDLDELDALLTPVPINHPTTDKDN